MKNHFFSFAEKTVKKLLVFVTFIALISVNNSCKRNLPDVPEESLRLIASYDLAVPEPSGLAPSAQSDRFYTVSDQTNQIYQISSTGQVLETYSYKGADLEGIAFNPNTSSFWIVQERTREVLQLRTNGTEFQRFTLNIPQGNANQGLEGITYNTKNGYLYILNETNPGLLLVVSTDGTLISQFTLDFAQDYSGIFYEKNDDVLWILSDESQSVSKCDLEGKVIESFATGIDKGEGVVVDADKKNIFIVSDSADKLYLFSYTEKVNNSVK